MVSIRMIKTIRMFFQFIKITAAFLAVVLISINIYWTYKIQNVISTSFPNQAEQEMIYSSYYKFISRFIGSLDGHVWTWSDSYFLRVFIDGQFSIFSLLIIMLCVSMCSHAAVLMIRKLELNATNN